MFTCIICKKPHECGDECGEHTILDLPICTRCFFHGLTFDERTAVLVFMEAVRRVRDELGVEY